MKRPTRRILRTLLRILLVVVGSLALLELILVLTSVELRILGKYVYRNEGNETYEGSEPLYRLSADPERVYELVPGANVVCRGCTHPLEPKVDRTEISVNDLGFRGREFPTEKGSGVFRVIILGGSNTFGMSVGDNDTYPARIQARLEALGHRDVEVWNAGLNAYVLSQKVAWLREIARRYQPDLVLIQDHNVGWRPLLRGDDQILGALRANPTLIVEALPATWGEPDDLHPRHEWLVQHLRIWRAGYAVVLYLELRAQCGGDARQFYGCITEEWRQRFRAVSQRHSVAALREFMAGTDLPVILVDTVDNRHCPGPDPHDRLRDVPGVRFYSFCDASKPEEYRHIHPPSYVYEWYAERLVDDLILPELQQRREVTAPLR